MVFFTDFGFHMWFGFRISHGFGFLEIRVSHRFGFQGSWIHKDLDSQGLGFSHSSDSDFAWMRVFTGFGFSQRFRFHRDSDIQGSP